MFWATRPSLPHLPRTKKRKTHRQRNHDMHLQITPCPPTSAPWQQRADSWHHNSLCLCREKAALGSERSWHHISLSGPVTEIITCTDKMPQSYFWGFFLVLHRQMFRHHWSWFQDTCTVVYPVIPVKVPALLSNQCWVGREQSALFLSFPNSSLSPASK